MLILGFLGDVEIVSLNQHVVILKDIFLSLPFIFTGVTLGESTPPLFSLLVSELQRVSRHINDDAGMYMIDKVHVCVNYIQLYCISMTTLLMVQDYIHVHF